MINCKFSFLTFVVAASLSLTVLRAFVDGSLSTSGVNGPPSPPRNLRRTVLGVIGDDREYQVRWSASKDNGGRAVNYTLKMCSTWNASFCKDIHNQNCQAINVVSTTEEFFCILEHKDFLSSCGEFCDYILCAVASNDFGKNESCIRAPYGVQATPRPPLHFEVLNSKDGGVTVRWQERDSWKYFGRLYTVLYHVLNQPLANKTKEVANQTSLSLSGLQAFTTYCVYLMVQFVNGRKERSAHSSVLGPSCIRTPPGDLSASSCKCLRPRLNFHLYQKSSYGFVLKVRIQSSEKTGSELILTGELQRVLRKGRIDLKKGDTIRLRSNITCNCPRVARLNVDYLVAGHEDVQQRKFYLFPGTGVVETWERVWVSKFRKWERRLAAKHLGQKLIRESSKRRTEKVTSSFPDPDH